MVAEQDFWTKRIRLEEISRDAYYALGRGWAPNASEKDVSDTYAGIVNPVTAEDYGSLIAMFLTHPAAATISVVESGRGWHKFTVGEITPDAVKAIISFAENDDYGYGNFEMRFKPVQPNADGIRERAKIIFREVGDLLVGYKIKVHRDNLPLFDSNIINPRELIVSAMADPRNYNI